MPTILASSSNPVVTAMVTGLTSIGNDAMEGIGAVLPVALPIVGAILVVTIGIRVFKKVSH